MCEDVNRIRHQLVNQLMKHRSIKITRRGVDRPLGGGAVAATSFAYPSPVSFDFHFLRKFPMNFLKFLEQLLKLS